MKKHIVFLVTLVTIGQAGLAQYSDYYYHRVGDTIEWRSEIGYYSWWEYEHCYENNITLDFDSISMYGSYGATPGTWWAGFFDSNVLLQRFYTPSPLKIIGIAGAGWQLKSLTADSCDHQNYYYIYDADDTGLTLKAEMPWSMNDPSRTLHIRRHSLFMVTPSPDSCCYHNPVSDYVPIREYYFDSAIWVTDSFYVGGSFFSVVSLNPDTQNGYYMAHYSPRKDSSCAEEAEIVQVINGDCYPIGVVLMYKPQPAWGGSAPHQSFQEREWIRWTDASMSPIIYPIIEVDTTVPPASACDSIANVQVTVAGTSATVTWDDFPNYSRVLLRHGNRNEPLSQWREEEVTGSTLFTLTGLNPVTFYGVTMKAECEGCKKETPWSEPLYFYIATDTSGGGTEGVEGGETLLSRMTFLQPNPARDEVTVTSSFNLTAIDIWTADGVMVHHQAVSGHDVTVDVSWLRSGTYIVAIRTHAGTTHKRLLIVR